MKFNFFLISLILLTNNLKSIEPIGQKDVPRYIYSNFDSDLYSNFDINRFITMKGMPRIYFPSITNDEANQPIKTKPGPILTKSGLQLVQITNDNSAQDETWIAVNPTNPLNAIATCNDGSTNGSGGQYKMPSYVTFDGGKTWAKYTTQNHNSKYLLQAKGGATIFDPAIVFNKDGKAIYGYGFATDYKNNGENAIFISVSDDGGVTWNKTESYEDVYQVTYAPSGYGLQDRYTMGVDLFSEKYEGNVYLTWRDFGSSQSIKIGFAGKSNYQEWNERTVFSSNPATQAPVPIADYKGQVWVSYRFSSASEKTSAPIYLSTDGGNSFQVHSNAMEAWNIGTPRDNLPSYARVSLANKDSMRMSTNPQLAVDNSNGPYRGNIYCIMPSKEGGLNGPTRITLSTLKNGVEDTKAKWVEARIDNNPYGNDMFFPSVTVDPVTGFVHVFYYTSQFDPDNILIDAMYAYSYDGGATFKYKRLTDESVRVKAVSQQDEGNRYWGDYARVEAYGNRVYPLFWLSKAPSYNHSTCELFTSIITTAPVGPEIVNLEYKSSSNSIDLSWSGIYDGLGEIIEDYTVKLYKDGKFITEFEKSTSNYNDKDVESGKEYTYGFQVISKDVRGTGDIYDHKIIVGGGLVLMPPSDFQALSHPEGILFKWKTPNMTEGGTEINDVSGINIYMKDEIIATVPANSLQAGEYNTFVWKTETEKFYTDFTSTALRERDGEVGESESSEFLPLAYAGAPFMDFAEDFESEDEMVPTLKTGKWGISNDIASKGEFSLTQSPYENYGSSEDSYIIFPPLVTTSQKPNLVFDMIALVRDKDYVMFEVTKDNGRTWQFGNKISVSWGAGLWDNQTYSLDKSEWLLSSLNFLDRGFKSGDTVMLKISFKATPIPRAPGVFIDNMRMDAISNVANTLSPEISVYPNPSNEEININYEVLTSSNIKIEIFDVLSNNIITLDKGFMKYGVYSENLKLSELTSGTYFVRISNGIQQKMIPFSVSK